MKTKGFLRVIAVNFLVTLVICLFVYLGISFIELDLDFTKWPIERRKELVQIWFILPIFITLLYVFFIYYHDDEFID
jgi:hypothetical protein